MVQCLVGFFSPSLPRVFKIANLLFFLAINTDDGFTRESNSTRIPENKDLRKLETSHSKLPIQGCLVLTLDNLYTSFNTVFTI